MFPDEKIKPMHAAYGAFTFEEKVEDPPIQTRRALIDGDMLVYQCCYSDAVKDGLNAVKRVWDTKINTILTKCRAESHKTFLTGGENNFRFTVCPNYKDNRAEREKPKFYHELRAWAVADRGATMIDDAEADDALCYTHNRVADIALEHTIICTDDKDLDMVPGWHYRLRTAECYLVEADYGTFDIKRTDKGLKIRVRGPVAFYYQMLIGDSTDGIPGLGQPAEETRAAFNLRKAKGCGPVCAYTMLEACESLLDASYVVACAYKAKYGPTWYTEYLTQARLLWMQTVPGELYTPSEETINYWKERAHAD